MNLFKFIPLLLAACCWLQAARAQVVPREATTAEVAAGTIGMPAVITPRRLSGAGTVVVPITNRSTITVSAFGLGNGATLANNGALFGPDTPDTTTSGIMEAYQSAANVTATNYGPLAGAVDLQFSPGYFYYSTPMVFSNTYNAGITFAGADLLSTKLVYTGTNTGISCIKFIAGRTNNGELNRQQHIFMHDIGFSSVVNTTNILVELTASLATFVGERLNFTSWRVMTNHADGASVTMILTGGSAPGLVGLAVNSGSTGEHGFSMKDIFFADLADGMLLTEDHFYGENIRSAFVGSNQGTATNLWGTNSIYSLGALIIDQGQLDHRVSNLHLWGGDVAVARFQNGSTCPMVIDGFFNESGQHSIISDNSAGIYDPIVYNSVDIGGNSLRPVQIKTFRSNPYVISNTISPTSVSAGMAGGKNFNGTDSAYEIDVAGVTKFAVNATGIYGNGYAITNIAFTNVLPEFVWSTNQIGVQTNVYYSSNAPDATYGGIFYYIGQQTNAQVSGSANFTNVAFYFNGTRYLADYRQGNGAVFQTMATNQGDATKWAYDNNINSDDLPPNSSGNWERSTDGTPFAGWTVYAQILQRNGNGAGLTNVAQNATTYTNFLLGSSFTNTTTRNELVVGNARCNPTTTGNALFALVTSPTGATYTTNSIAGLEADAIFTTAPHGWFQLTAQVPPGGIWKFVDKTGEGFVTMTNCFYQTLQ